MKKRVIKAGGLKAKKVVIKELKCSNCDRIERVDEDVVAVQCYKCTADKAAPPEIRQLAKKEPKENRKPKGWQLMKVFVDHEKNVYHKGTEKPELKGTLEPTVIEPKRKLTPAEKDAIKDKKIERLAKKHKKKQQQKSEAPAEINGLKATKA